MERKHEKEHGQPLGTKASPSPIASKEKEPQSNGTKKGIHGSRLILRGSRKGYSLAGTMASALENLVRGPS